MAGGKGKYAYISDDGETYSISMDDSNAAAAGNTADATSPNLPNGYHPRYVLADHATNGSQRKIIIGDPTNALFVGPAAGTISLMDFSLGTPAAAAHAVRSRVGEKRYNR